MKRTPFRLLWMLGLIVSAAPWLSGRSGIDYRQMRNEIEIFETILHTSIKNEFNHPLALVSEPQGSYLPGYGVNFSFLLNINRDEVTTPFGVRKFNQSGHARADKLRLIREMMLKLLGEYGNAVTQLTGDENFSVSAHLEDRTSLVPNEREEVLVFRVAKKTLADYSARKIDLKQFRERVEIIEY